MGCRWEGMAKTRTTPVEVVNVGSSRQARESRGADAASGTLAEAVLAPKSPRKRKASADEGGKKVARDDAPRGVVAEAPQVSKREMLPKTESNSRAMRTIGLDVGKRHIYIAVATNRAITERHRVDSVEELIAWLGDTPAIVGFEACRQGWYLADELEARGHCALMIDTTRVAEIGIGRHGKKNDKIDAERVALAVARGDLPEAHILSRGRRELRHAVNARACLVETRAKLIITARGMLSSCGVEVKGDADAFVEQAAKLTLPPQVADVIPSLLQSIASVTISVQEVDRKLIQSIATDAVARRLMTVPGVGPIVAACFICVIDDPKRFKSATQVGSYVGLAPSESSSGASGQQLGHITKAGNSQLRSLLVQAALVILTLPKSYANDPLYVWGRQVKERRGKTMIAAVALARKLSEILWSMWKHGTVYDPEHVARRSAQGVEADAKKKAHIAAQLRKLEARERVRATKQRNVIRTALRADALLNPSVPSTPKAKPSRRPTATLHFALCEDTTDFPHGA